MSWSVFEDKTFPGVYPFDCANAVKGTCLKTNFKNCMALCQESPRCNFGYYKSTGECFPLSSENARDINPYDYMTDETIEVVPNDKVFINDMTYPRVSNANQVKYYDTIALRNVETGMFLQPGEEKDLFVTFAPFEADLTLEYKNVVSPRNRVRYNDELTFGIPNHPLILTRGLAKQFDTSLGLVSWNNFTPYSMLQIALFKLENIDDPRDTNAINFGDKFYINILGHYLTVDDQSHGVVKFASTQKLKSLKANFTFEMLPARSITGYYCNNTNKCTSVPLFETQPMKDARYYQNKEVLRTESCFFNC